MTSKEAHKQAIKVFALFILLMGTIIGLFYLFPQVMSALLVVIVLGGCIGMCYHSIYTGIKRNGK